MSQPIGVLDMRVRALSIIRVAAVAVSFAVSAHIASAAQPNVVIHAAEVTSYFGAWTKTPDSTAAGGFALTTPDLGGATVDPPLASPADYFDETFTAVS